jgi:hypothetical protein
VVTVSGISLSETRTVTSAVWWVQPSVRPRISTDSIIGTTVPRSTCHHCSGRVSVTLMEPCAEVTLPSTARLAGSEPLL